MNRRDTERIHQYSNEIFHQLKIYDLQGILKEGDSYKCGIEAYQVKDFIHVDFHKLQQNIEVARYLFCQNLDIPYYVVVISESARLYRIYSAAMNLGSIEYKILYELNERDFVDWWRSKQSFNQKKAMYNARKRIQNSLIDQLLFSNSLAWGMNVDGFSIDSTSRKISNIFEKRICTHNPPRYTIINYDPNRYFHGTMNRSGDYPSWKQLFELSNKFAVPLILLTFDTSNNNYVGATKIINVSKKAGLTYKDNLKPYENIYTQNICGLRDYIT